MLFVIVGLFVLFMIRMLFRSRRLTTSMATPGTGNSSSTRIGQLVPPASLLSASVESREPPEGKSESNDDVLQYVPMGSAKEVPVESKKKAAPVESDDQLAEILTRIEGLQKKILFQLCVVSLLAIALIVCVGLYFYYKGEWF